MDAPRRDPDRFALFGSLVLLAFIVPFACGLVYLAATHASPRLLPVFVFAALVSAGLAFVGAMAPWRVVRDPRVRASFARACPRCPGCGLPSSDNTSCAWCAMPLTDVSAWWRVDPPLWMESVAGLSVGLGFVSLGVFLLAAPFVEVVRGGPAVLLALVGSVAMFFGGSIAALAAGTFRVQWTRPPSLSLQRTWLREGTTWSATAKATLGETGWRAEGSCEGLGDEPAGGAAETDDPFARGLARVLAGWHRDGRAPLVCVTVARWSWGGDADTREGDVGVYREAPRAKDDPGLRRAVSQVWRVSFNEHGFGELLEGDGLRAGPAALGDDEAAELGDAEWDVDVAMISRVVSRDEALREAIAARGRAPGDDDAEVARALLAVRAG